MVCGHGDPLLEVCMSRASRRRSAGPTATKPPQPRAPAPAIAHAALRTRAAAPVDELSPRRALASSVAAVRSNMPTISRETILIDRRQPTLRWSAVFAGAVCSIGLWMLLQLLGLGLGLTAVDADNIRSLRGAGITTTVWSLIAPLVAMFFGGLLTGKLAQTYEHRLAAIHGVLMWSLTAVVGLCATI